MLILNVVNKILISNSNNSKKIIRGSYKSSILEDSVHIALALVR